MIFGFGVSIFFVKYVVEVYFVMFVGVIFRYIYGSVMENYKNIIIMVFNEIIQFLFSYVYQVELMVIISGVIIEVFFVGKISDCYVL